MRALLLIALLAKIAHAETVVVMVEPDAAPDVTAALQVALAGRNVTLAPAMPPAGAMQLERAAAAQREAIGAGAFAALWLDVGEVCVVSTDGRVFRHVPLSEGSPRAFAAIAVSLLDELHAPLEGPSVNIDIQIAPPGIAAQAPAPAQAAAPVAQSPVADRTLLEVGVTASPATYGIEAELAFPVVRSMRFGVHGSINKLYDGIGDMSTDSSLVTAAGELRHVGEGATHLDVGLMGGIGHNTYDNGGLAALRLMYVSASGVELSAAPTYLFSWRGHDATLAGFIAMRWKLAL